MLQESNVESRYGRLQRSTVLASLPLFLAIATAGCGGSGGTSAGVTSAADLKGVLTVLGLEYGAFVEANGKRAPKDEAAFRLHIERRLGELAMYQIESIDQLFAKGRDGEPLVISCGKLRIDNDEPDYPIAAWESRGVGGARLAVNTRGGVTEFDAAEFKLKFPED